MFLQEYNEKFMDMPKTKAGGDHSSRRFEEVPFKIIMFENKKNRDIFCYCEIEAFFPTQDFIRSDHDDLGDVDINDISEDEIR